MSVVSTRFDEMLETRLTALARAGLLRDRDAPRRAHVEAAAGRAGRRLLDLSSNDYLGFAGYPLLPSPAPGGAGSSRLIHGTRDAHVNLERALAEWLGTEDALLFASGYAANVGVVSALAQPGDLIASDALNHASLIDGCRLSRAEVRVVPHGDLAALRELLTSAGERTVWVVSEAYFSMDGAVCDVAAVAELLAQYPNAHLVLDEAHSLGVFGPRGRGLAAAVGHRPAALIGTFGKAFGLHGAFVAGSRALCRWLWNRARSFVYSTATSPALADVLQERVALVGAADDRRAHLAELCRSLHEQLAERFPSLHPASAQGPIAPLILGSAALALDKAAALGECGILTQAIRPPTVPIETSRLRMSLGVHLSHDDLAFVVETLGEVLAELDLVGASRS